MRSRGRASALPPNKSKGHADLNVVMDCTPLLVRSAGVKTYLYHLYENLKQQQGDRIRPFPPFRSLSSLDLEHNATRGFSAKAAVALALGANYLPLPLLNPFGWGSDLFHTSNLIRNPPRNVRLTSTIHDLTCWITPELHHRTNIDLDHQFAERVLRKADRLIAVSEASRQDAARVLGLDPARIETIHHGVDNRFFHTHPEEAWAKFSLHTYILSVGTVEPRKNLGRLLDAFETLPAEMRAEFPLVIAGPIGWEKPSLVARLKSTAHVRYLGYVDDADLPSLTAGATVFAYPSLYEGFGFPVAQAMACGVPVVTSNVSSLPEVLGEGGVLVDPRSEAEIASALSRLLTSPAGRTRLGTAGRARAAQCFRWERCARQTWSFFERACA